MPIINKYEIQRYREVLINVQPGLVDDGQYSTFLLETFDTNPNGTGHFVGLIKTGVLLGDVVKNSLNTGNITLQQFNAMTLKQVNEYIERGLFISQRQILGWVELSRSIPSFYYQDCYNGKIPIVDRWYDFTNIEVRQNVLSNDDSLTTIGVWDINDSFNNWGTTPYPNQTPLTFYQYFDIVTNDAFIDGVNFTKFNLKKLYNIPLIQANKLDHFDGNESYPTSFTFFSNKTTYGRFRRSELQVGFNFGNAKTNGACIGLPTVIKDDTDTSTDRGVGENNDADVGITSDIVDTYVYTGMSPDEFSKQFVADDVAGDFFKVSGSPIPYPSVMQSFTSGQYLRMRYLREEINRGVIDPRDLPGEDIDTPSGFTHAYLNADADILTIKPAILKEPLLTSAPSEIGPIRKSRARIMRRNVIDMYDLYNGVYKENSGIELYKNRLLIHGIGSDSNGYNQVSDSESFREKCVFTGYGNSFDFGFHTTMAKMRKLPETDPLKKIYSSLYTILSDNGYADSAITSNQQAIPIIYRSKTNKYYYTNTPCKTIFAGYMESVPMDIGDKLIRFDNLFYDKLSHLPKNDILDTFEHIQLPVFPTDKYKRPVFYHTVIGNKTQTQEFVANIYDILSQYVYKDDFILSNTKSKLSPQFSYPSIMRRTELFVPNPIDNLLWADMIMWTPNIVKYDVVQSIKLLNGFSSYITGKKSKFVSLIERNQGRIVPFDLRFEPPQLQYSDDYGYFISITDKTYMTDVYFALMEMHLKGYPWSIILSTINKFIPNSSVNLDIINGKTILVSPFRGTTKPYLPKVEIDMDGDWFTGPLSRLMQDIFLNISSDFLKTWNYMIDNSYIKGTKARPSR